MEPTGSQTEVLVDFGNEIWGSVLVQGRYQQGPGSTAFIDPVIDNAHLFHSDTGERIN